MEKLKVKDIMTKDIISVKKDTSFCDVAKLMEENDIGFIPILDNGKVIGVVTDRDMVIRGVSSKVKSNTDIGHYMTQEVISIEANASIEEASQLMAKRQIKRLLVIDNDKLVGILSLADITNNNEKNATRALIGINKKA